MKIIALTIEKLGFYLLTCCVAFAPVPFGSNSDGFAGLIGLMLTVALFGTFAAPDLEPRGRALCAVALAIAVVIAGWSAIQVAPLFPGSWASPAWSKVQDLLGGTPGVIAAARYQPLHSLGYLLLPFAAFVAALSYLRDGARYTAFMNIIIAVGLVVTLVCLVQHMQSPGALLWAEKKHYLGVFTGSFVNPNTAATYFGVVMLLALSAGLRQTERVNMTYLVHGHSPGGAAPVRWGSVALYLGTALVFFVALMLTQSRAGIVASLSGTGALLAALAYIAARTRTTATKALALGVMAMAGVTLLALLFGGRLLRRLELEGVVDEGRACTFEATWRAIGDHFWLGTGLGTFQDVFPTYRLAECGLEGHWNMAHNLFLEGMLSLGVPMLAACALVIYALLIGTYVRGVRERRQLRFVPVGCLAILLTLTLHSAVDFSLQIPAIAVLAAGVLGAGAAISIGRPDGSSFLGSGWLPAR